MILSRLRRLLASRQRLPRRLFMPSPQSPWLETDKWSASEVISRLISLISYRPYPVDELLLMSAAFQFHRPDVVIDIGTHLGKSARVWWELSREYQIPCAIHTIDLCDPQHVEYPGEQLGTYLRGTSVQQHIGDGGTVAREIITAQAETRVLLFLDGDHTYDTVRRELELLLLPPCVAALVHDTFYQPGSGYNHGPYEAIRDFGQEHPCTQVVHLSTGLPGMSYLSR